MYKVGTFPGYVYIIVDLKSHWFLKDTKISLDRLLGDLEVGCVTGIWKTDQIVTLGLFHFIGPANGYICTLHIATQCQYQAWLTGQWSAFLE